MNSAEWKYGNIRYLALCPKDIAWSASFYFQREQSQYCQRLQKARAYSSKCLHQQHFHHQLEIDKYALHCFAIQILFYSAHKRISWNKCSTFIYFFYQLKLTLNFCSSVFEMVSALAIMGITLTLVSSFFIHTKSMDFSLRTNLLISR